MKIFLDTADIEEIKKVKEWSLLDGVTTNPSLIKKAVEKYGNRDMEDYIKEICSITNGPVSLEVTATSSEEIVREAKILYEKFNPVNGNVVVKVPIDTTVDDSNHFEGLRAIKTLSKLGIPANATLVMTPEQAILAAKAGASYVSPFLGRVDDYVRELAGVSFEKWDYWNASMASESSNGIRSGIELLESIIKIYRAYNFKTKIIAASMRNPRQVREAAELGVNIVTLPFRVLEEMIKHYKTMEGMKKFLKDVIPEYRGIFTSANF